MIPTSVAVLIYQILAFLGVMAVEQLVAYYSFKRKDLKIKLMYSQSPDFLLRKYLTFKRSPHNIKFLTVFLFLFFGTAVTFIPTIMTQFHTTGIIYYNYVNTVPTTAEILGGLFPDANDTYYMPIIEVFVDYLQGNDIYDTMQIYLINSTKLNVSNNAKGFWYDSTDRPVMFPFNDKQANEGVYGFHVDYFNTTQGMTLSTRTYNAFGSRDADVTEPSSSTLEECSTDPANLITNLTSVYGLAVKAARRYDKPCYPIYDPSATIYRINVIPNTASVLSQGDTIYRSILLDDGVVASSSFALSLFNHNSTHMTMGIAKRISITMFSSNNTIPPPTNCSNSPNMSMFAMNFQEQPHDAVLCNLFQTANKANPYAVIQAYGRFYQDNYAINAVYTVQNGQDMEPGQSAMVDLNMFAAYTLQGQLASSDEVLVAYESYEFGSKVKASQEFSKTLEDNALGSIITSLDSSIIDPDSLDMLVSMASMRTRWSHSDYSDFSRISAKMVNAIDTPVWWIIVVVVLFVVFLIPQLARIPLNAVPNFGKDLKSILISAALGDEDDDAVIWRGELMKAVGDAKMSSTAKNTVAVAENIPVSNNAVHEGLLDKKRHKDETSSSDNTLDEKNL